MKIKTNQFFLNKKTNQFDQFRLDIGLIISLV